MNAPTWQEKVRALEVRGWSLVAIADHVGLSPQGVSDIKQGRTKAPGGDAAIHLHHIYSTGAKPPVKKAAA
jgi:transcriptional regulator with XRE-family HTH domain